MKKEEGKLKKIHMLVFTTYKFIMGLQQLIMQFLTGMEEQTAQGFFEQTSISFLEENCYQDLKQTKWVMGMNTLDLLLKNHLEKHAGQQIRCSWGSMEIEPTNVEQQQTYVW